MIVSMTLLSDAIFGNGVSVPGGEDISVHQDEFGFPYYKGNTFKGVFREEYENYLLLVGYSPEEADKKLGRLFGAAGDHEMQAGKLMFTDFVISESVKKLVLSQKLTRNQVLKSCTYERILTTLDDNGQVQEGMLRTFRCIKKNLTFYGSISVNAAGKREEEAQIQELREVLGMVKWLGTGRTRGLGRVRLKGE